MSLDVGTGKVLDNPRVIPGPAVIRFMAASFLGDRRCGARYIFAAEIPLAFNTPAGPQKSVFKQPPFVLSEGDRQPIDMDVTVVPQGAAPSVARVDIEISEIDDAGKPVGTLFRTTATIQRKQG